MQLHKHPSACHERFCSHLDLIIGMDGLASFKFLTSLAASIYFAAFVCIGVAGFRFDDHHPSSAEC